MPNFENITVEREGPLATITVNRPKSLNALNSLTLRELTVAVRVAPTEATASLDQELPVPEDWSILVEKATALPEPPPSVTTRQQQMAQQQ